MRNFFAGGLVAGALSLVLLPAATLQAQDKLPLSGSTSYTTAYVDRNLTALEMGDHGGVYLSELTGVTHNTKGEPYFDRMAVRCLLSYRMANEEEHATGACIETDPDGDKVFTSFDDGVHHLVGGTGKYEGISGEAPYSLEWLASPDDGFTAYLVPHEVSWEFK